jgi:hypothetical protein
MSQDVEELFGEGAGAPTARTPLVWVLLAVGLLFALLGMFCTAAPGGVLVLLAWFVVEKEVDRIDSGYLPASARPAVRRARFATLVGVLLVIAMLVAQTFMVGMDVYALVWSPILEWWAGSAGAPPPLPAPAPGPVIVPVP